MFFYIFICVSSLKDLCDKIAEHRLLPVTGATESNHLADLHRFLQRDDVLSKDCRAQSIAAVVFYI